MPHTAYNGRGRLEITRRNLTWSFLDRRHCVNSAVTPRLAFPLVTHLRKMTVTIPNAINFVEWICHPKCLCFAGRIVNIKRTEKSLLVFVLIDVKVAIAADDRTIDRGHGAERLLDLRVATVVVLLRTACCQTDNGNSKNPC